MSAMQIQRASEVEVQAPPNCPTCGNEMPAYGGSGGYICCDWKLLYRGGGWFDDAGLHLDDDRLNSKRTHGIKRRA